MLKDKVGFARTFSITSFLFCGLGKMNKDLWILSIMYPINLFTPWYSITSSITWKAKLISIRYVVIAHQASHHFFAQVFRVICLCISNFHRLCSSHNWFSFSSICFCFTWSSLGLFMPFLPSFFFGLPFYYITNQPLTYHKHILLNYCKKKLEKKISLGFNTK